VGRKNSRPEGQQYRFSEGYPCQTGRKTCLIEHNIRKNDVPWGASFFCFLGFYGKRNKETNKNDVSYPANFPEKSFVHHVNAQNPGEDIDCSPFLNGRLGFSARLPQQNESRNNALPVGGGFVTGLKLPLSWCSAGASGGRLSR
jgi:hypothetical protein